MTKSRRKNLVTTIALILAFVTGLSLLLYPTFSNWWNTMHQNRAVADYDAIVADHSKEENEKIWSEAEEYNQKMFREGEGIHTLTQEEYAEYESLLDITGTGIMGYVEIPKINVKLPIYHGTDEAILQVAIGHIPSTSLPTGGANTHCVVSGHRGLPSARLFTDLDQMKEGDTFLVHVMDHTLTYEVDRIRTVLPDELDDLNIVEGADYFTLVTCTPYGVNSHRLLVRGHRIEDAEETIYVSADAYKIDPLLAAPVIAAFIILILLIWYFLASRAKKRMTLDSVPSLGRKDDGSYEKNEK